MPQTSDNIAAALGVAYDALDRVVWPLTAGLRTVGLLRTPWSPNELTAGFLSSVVGYQVASFECVEFASGMSAGMYRITLTPRVGESIPRGKPTKIAAKFTRADFMGRVLTRAFQNYTEATFYRVAAPLLRKAGVCEIPQCYFSLQSPTTGQYVLFLEDLAPCRMLHAETRPDSNEPAESPSEETIGRVLRGVAHLHGRFFGSKFSELPEFDTTFGVDAAVSLAHSSEELALSSWTEGKGGEMVEVFFNEKLTASIERAFKLGVTSMCRAGVEWAQRHNIHVANHGDVQNSNMLVQASENASWSDALQQGRLVYIDWQSFVIGLPGADVMYYLLWNTSTEYRRANFELLLEDYRVAVEEQSGQPLDPELLRDAVKFHVVTRVLPLLAMCTNPSWGLMKNPSSRAYIGRIIERTIAYLDEHDDLFDVVARIAGDGSQ